MSENRKPRSGKESDLLSRVRAAARQEQFLEVVSAEEAKARFERHLDLRPLPAEMVDLSAARTRALTREVVAPFDAPPFVRSLVSAFTVRTSGPQGPST